MKKRYDIAIIGGGAAGLAAAISAKRTSRGLSVGIIERLPKVGKKILATGNGRCNLSNSDLSSDRYHGSCKKLLELTNRFSVPKFFESLGVLCADDGFGRIYPHCRSAASVLDALKLETEKLGVEEICGYEVGRIELRNYSGRELYAISSEKDTVTAKKVILAGGGKSQSALGSNGSMFEICRSTGIDTVLPYPALVPLRTDTALVKPLKGVRAEANVMFRANDRIIASSRGEVQFTEELLSGICVFDLSYLYEQYKAGSELQLDLLPDMSSEDVSELLKGIRSIRSQARSDDFLSGIFPYTLGAYILKRSIPKYPKTAGNISDDKLREIAVNIKSLRFPITGTAGYERSQVTGGGISYNELTGKLELKKSRGMYACGEVLDIFGDCGGYNLDFAFSSGAIAGESAALTASV